MNSSEPNLTHYALSDAMHARFGAHQLRRRVVLVAYVLMFVAYLCWRVTILEPRSMLFSIAFLVAECLGFLIGLITLFTSWRYQPHRPAPVPEGCTVDVLIPTYKEPLCVIRRTLMAAKEITYAHGTIVLDDGRREDVRALAEELGITYYSRSNNAHAKAGNLNFGLGFSHAEYVLVLDADHIAKPEAIDLLLGHFAAPDVAMVQAPQDYYNTDGFQYIRARDGRLWDEQSFFFNVSQPCRDAVNGASSVGTGLMFRRSMMDAIGGFPTETATEDVHASLRLHKAGWRVLYINQPIAYGIAAHDLGEYYKTRHRWAHGNIHALRVERVLTCKGLTLKQRVAYLYLGLVYLEGWQQLLLFMIPIGALLFGLPPFQITVFNALFMLAFPFLCHVMLQEMGCGFSRFWSNELFTMARWPVYIAASRGFFGLPIRWRSSSKTASGTFNWALVAPQLAVLLLSLGALVYGIIKLHGDTSLSPVLEALIALATFAPLNTEHWFEHIQPGYTLDLVLLAGIWACVNALRAALFIRKTLVHAQASDPFFRFAIDVPVQIGAAVGQSIAISETWLKLALAGDVVLRLGELVAVTLAMLSGPLVVQVRPSAIYTRHGQTVVEGSFVWEGEAGRDQLSRDLYAVEWHRPLAARFAYFNTPLDWLTGWMRLSR